MALRGQRGNNCIDATVTSGTKLPECYRSRALKLSLGACVLAAIGVVCGNGAQAQQRCAQCHPREAESYTRSAMAQSVGTPEGQPGGKVFHKKSGSAVVIRTDRSGMTQTIQESGLGARYRISYYVGAGIVGRSYLVRIGDSLFQSPVSYFTRTRAWDLTPGYEPEQRLDFDHQIAGGCLFCHTGESVVTGASNRYLGGALTPISCQRCHGSGEAHIKSPTSTNIVNPARLAPRARDSVCEQCHLEGAARILNPGKDWWDFRPGGELENTFSVYLERGVKSLKAVSHPEQLAMSQCFRRSGGRLWCGTCHDPHSPTADRKQELRAICRSCHQQLSAQAHSNPASADCTSCHMPARKAGDVAHAAITDHRILRTPQADQDQPPTALPMPAAWHEPAAPLDRRNLGLACLQLAREYRNGPLARAAVRLLAPVAGKTGEDPDLVAALGALALEEGEPSNAAKLFAEAQSERPDDAGELTDEAIALEMAGKAAQAIKTLEQAIRTDPALARSYFELARLYAAMGQRDAKKQTVYRYLKLFPQSIKGRLELGE